MLRSAPCVLACVLAGSAIAGPPLTMTEHVEFDGHRFPIPLEIYLEAQGQTTLAVKVAGNLRAIQANAPGLLSEVVVDDCDLRIGLQIDSATAEGDHIRLLGRAQVSAYTCRDEGDRKVRSRLITNIVGVNVLVHSQISDNCLSAKVEELELDPSGLVGGIMKILNITETISSEIQTELNSAMAEDALCLEMPDILKTVETHIAKGGFRDFGGGQLGFVVEGRVEVTAENAIALIEMLSEFEDECACD